MRVLNQNPSPASISTKGIHRGGASNTEQTEGFTKCRKTQTNASPIDVKMAFAVAVSPTLTGHGLPLHPLLD